MLPHELQCSGTGRRVEQNEFSHATHSQCGAGHYRTGGQSDTLTLLFKPLPLFCYFSSLHLLLLLLLLLLPTLQLFGIGYGHINAIQSVFVADQFREEKVSNPSVCSR